MSCLSPPGLILCWTGHLLSKYRPDARMEKGRKKLCIYVVSGKEMNAHGHVGSRKGRVRTATEIGLLLHPTQSPLPSCSGVTLWTWVSHEVEAVHVGSAENQRSSEKSQSLLSPWPPLREGRPPLTRKLRLVTRSFTPWVCLSC